MGWSQKAFLFQNLMSIAVACWNSLLLQSLTVCVGIVCSTLVLVVFVVLMHTCISRKDVTWNGIRRRRRKTRRTRLIEFHHKKIRIKCIRWMAYRCVGNWWHRRRSCQLTPIGRMVRHQHVLPNSICDSSASMHDWWHRQQLVDAYRDVPTMHPIRQVSLEPMECRLFNVFREFRKKKIMINCNAKRNNRAQSFGIVCYIIVNEKIAEMSAHTQDTE